MHLDCEQEMARMHYGYGQWEAPYWFIGPEQGKGREESDDNLKRINAWNQLGKTELCDCQKFHKLIGEMDWHKEHPRLQPTWRPLILLLMTILNMPTDNEALRVYQRERWGKSDDETCVIDLSGSAASSYRVKVDRKTFRMERVESIREKIRAHEPKFVVMYGASEARYWNQIAESELTAGNILKRDSTAFAVMQHPVAHGSANSNWIDLGRRLRDFIA